MSQQVKRAFKFRFYPTGEQAQELSRTFGCVRFVYNKALHERSEAWKLDGTRLGYAACSGRLTEWKRTDETAFLAEVSCVPLQQALRHLDTAYSNFFAKRARHPKFKSRKKSKLSAEYTRSGFRYRDGQLTLAKMREPLDIVWSRPLPAGVEPTTVTVSRDSAGRWFVSMLCDDVIEALPAAANRAVGIDVGLTSLATLSNGEKIGNSKHEKRDREKLAKAQRNLARKQPGSANRDKARVKVARVHARIGDRRRDHLHQLTTRLVRENQAIVIEDLAVSNMVKNHSLARAISDASWSELRRMLEYKCAWHGRGLVVIDRWFPSSKMCSGCGALAEKMPLHVREWVCACGAVHDRDVNAARNLLTAAGLAVDACGADVRPQGTRPGGQSALKQETLAAK
jgi:putative transposase